jgi:membrane-bound metal-dependent hydrolase YbcI (DUF457 family)
MPSPVGHFLAGAAIYLAGTTRERHSRMTLAIILLASIAPDFDFLPGIVIGDMRAFHHGISHSLTFALLVAALVFLGGRVRASAAAASLALLAAVAYSAHVLLDFVNVNEGTRGVALLWPISDELIGINLRLFGHFRYGDITEGIWSVARSVNILPLVREAAVLGGLVLALMWMRRLSNPFR